MSRDHTKASRFRYNQGIYRIKMKVGDDWQDVSPCIGGSFQKCKKILEHWQKESDIEYQLFCLKEIDSVVVWEIATEDNFYFKENQIELLRFFKILNLSRDDHGFSIMSNITQISKTAIVKMMRNPADPLFQGISNEGLLYIRYCVQQSLQRESKDEN